MNTTLIFSTGMAVAVFFAVLMLHQAYSTKPILGSDGKAGESPWLASIGSALMTAIGFGALVSLLA